MAAYTTIAVWVKKAVIASGDPGIMQAYLRNTPQDMVFFCPQYWEAVQAELTRPLASTTDPEDPQLQQAVLVARMLATRACSHTRCTTVVGPSEEDQPRGKRCSGCRTVRYCGVGCQKADWPTHKAACRELRREQDEEQAGSRREELHGKVSSLLPPF